MLNVDISNFICQCAEGTLFAFSFRDLNSSVSMNMNSKDTQHNAQPNEI